jgi:hypothetical protein
MKIRTTIKTTISEIEANSEELRQSNTLADSFCNALRKAMTPYPLYDEDDETETEGES